MKENFQCIGGILIKFVKSKVPREFQKFLLNGDNKTRLLQLMFDYIVDNKAKVLNTLRINKLMLSKENMCTVITLSSVSSNNNLCSDHEEAETKVILHCIYVLTEYADMEVVLLSPSGDTDIMVIALSTIGDLNHVYFDYGTGSNRHSWWLEIDMSHAERLSILSLDLTLPHHFSTRVN